MRHNKFIFFSIFVGFIFFTYGWFFQKHPSYNHQQFDNYREIKNVFDSADKNTLFIFDVDDTLITTTDAIRFAPLTFKILAILKHLSHAFKYHQIASSLLQQTIFFVFDPDIVNYIHKLQQKECNVAALTLMKSGPYGLIQSMPEWRAQMLNDFGINLQGQFQDTTFTNMPKKGGSHPCLHKGILCTNWTDKGAVLSEFLDHAHLNPLHIIFFDDNSAMLGSVAAECAKRNINFSGYQCIGAKKFAGEWNNSRALFQLDYLIKHEQWLPDKQADALKISNN